MWGVDVMKQTPRVNSVYQRCVRLSVTFLDIPTKETHSLKLRQIWFSIPSWFRDEQDGVNGRCE